MRSRAVEMQEIGESTVIGTAVVVISMVLSLVVVGYFAWYAPVKRAQQTVLQVDVPSVSRPSAPASQGTWVDEKSGNTQMESTTEVSAL